MSAFRSSPGALRLLAWSLVARLPLTMIGIGLLVHAQRLTGSFAVAGLVSGAYAVATGAGGPALGRLADRRGQLAVLAPSVAATVALLGAAAALPAGVAPGLLVALAAGIGLATPPLAACVRALLPGVVRDPAGAAAAYAVDAAAVELTWVAGPPLALSVGAAWSTGGALAVAAAVLAVGTVAFAAQPATRAWRPAPPAERARGGSLRAPGLRTLVVVLVGVGVLFGAVEVGVTAAARSLGTPSAAGPLVGLWGLGSLGGGVVAARRGGRLDRAAALALVLALLGAGHVALAAAAGSVVALAAGLLVAGAAIAPTLAIAYAIVERVAPRGTVTEAFAWLSTATAVGSAVGASVAGALADGAGPAAAFLLAGVAGGAAALVAVLGARTLDAPAPVLAAPVPAAAAA
jgi:MFS family permease